MIWLQGGPFLEISTLLPFESDRQAFVNNILTKLKSFTPKVEFAITETELKEKIGEFSIGYPLDEKDPNSELCHVTQIPLYIDTDGKRKSVLFLSHVSNKLIAVDFWFFGSQWNAPEWNQKGVKKSQLPIFKNFLNKLFDTFEYIIGTVGYEVSVTDLFDTREVWPNEKYSLDNFKKEFLQIDNDFVMIIANKKYLDFQHMSGIRISGQRQILESKK